MTEKPLIIISSRTGNTLAVGHAVCDALPGAVMMRPSEVPDDLTPYNPVLLGFWCDRGDAPEEILRIAPRLRNKTIGCFATMGGDPEGEKSKAWMQKTSEKLVAMGEGNTLPLPRPHRPRGLPAHDRHARRHRESRARGRPQTERNPPRQARPRQGRADLRRLLRRQLVEASARRDRTGSKKIERAVPHQHGLFSHFACALPCRAIMRTSRNPKPAPRATTGDNTDEDPSHQRQSARRQHRPRA